MQTSILPTLQTWYHSSDSTTDINEGPGPLSLCSLHYGRLLDFFFLICEHNIKQLQEEEHGPEMEHGLQVLKYLLCDFHMVTQMQADSTF